ncbi:MAG: sulfur oxidation c-type cytochrome SoxX [Gammaproteobacteria bacterium]
MGTVMIAPTATAAEASAADIEEGKKIAFDRRKGNCLACHMIAGGNLPGNIGPPLIAMKARFPDRAKLRAQIADPTKANPNSIMPPFGRHDALTSAELEKVVDFIHTL